MKVGDLVKYRDRRTSDRIPNPWCIDSGEWGRMGIVMSVSDRDWETNNTI